jgi:hypothetical protein
MKQLLKNELKRIYYLNVTLEAEENYGNIQPGQSLSGPKCETETF